MAVNMSSSGEPQKLAQSKEFRVGSTANSVCRNLKKKNSLTQFSFLMPIGENCKVKHPKSGYEYNLTPLAGKDYEVKDLSYEYHFAVLAQLHPRSALTVPATLCPSCQVEGSAHRIAGEFVLFSIKIELVGHFFFIHV